MAKGSKDTSPFSRFFSYSPEKISSLSSFTPLYPSSLYIYMSSQTPTSTPPFPRSSSSSSSSPSQSRYMLSLLASKSFRFFSSLVRPNRTISPLKKSRQLRRRLLLSQVCHFLAVVAMMWTCRYPSPSYSFPLSSLSSTPLASAKSSFSNSREFSSSSLRPLVLFVLAERKKRVFALPRRSLSDSHASISPSRFSPYSQDSRTPSCPSSFLLLSSTHLTDRQNKTSFFLSSSPPSSLPSCSSSSLLSSLSSPYSSPRRALASTTDSQNFFSSVRTASHQQRLLHGVGDIFSSPGDFSCPRKRPLACPLFASSHTFSSSSSFPYSRRIAAREKEGQDRCPRRLFSTIRDGAVLPSTLGEKEESPDLQGRRATCGDEKTGGRLEERPSAGEALRKKDALWSCYLEGEEADKELKKLFRDSPYSRVVQGLEGEKNFQIFIGNATREKSQSLLSPWHDVPLIAHQERRRKEKEEERGEEREERGEEEEMLFNAVIEIPKNTRKKMEIQTHLELNPIMQDVKPDGELREYASTMYWNYGAFPQTWEDPRVAGGQEVFHARGDADPLDVVEIGSLPLPTGTVVPVKVLGALAMIDKGELDWKVLAIRQGDPLFSKLRNGLQDVERYCPGVISGIREWFRWYKLPTDNTLSLFGHEERAVSAEVAREVVLHAHHHYIVFLKAEKERRLKKLHKGPELQEGKQKRLTDDESIDEKALSSFWIPLRE